jgi:hypothetical protein
MSIIAEQDKLLQMSLQEGAGGAAAFPTESSPVKLIERTIPSTPRTSAKGPSGGNVGGVRLTTMTPSTMRLFTPSKLANLSPMRESDKENQRQMMITDDDEIDFL